MAKKDKKPKFYIVGRAFPKNGLGSIVSVLLGQIVWAVQKGYTPVVDLKNFSNIYFKDGREGVDNVWEYFFEQPCGYSLEDIPANAKVIQSKKRIKYSLEAIKLSVKENSFLPKSDNSIKLYQAFQKYFRLNEATKQFLQTRYEQLVGEDKPLVGVLARGSDYLSGYKPNGHPIQPTSEQIFAVIEQIKESSKEGARIFLATEDADIFQQFCDKYQDKLLAIDQYRYKASEKSIAEEPIPKANHHYNLALDYLTAIYTLSKCDCILSGWNGGLFLTCLLNRHYKFAHLFELGYWGDKAHPLPKRSWWWVKFCAAFILSSKKRKAFRKQYRK